ncbi:MAG: UvrD-helicase domain-containing protein [Desulfovibrio sp.]|jgi:superfamily I DNA/RNA helicase/PHP family Zn ribbon phosphoesterase|nr:UvrD-helicase domain-containing protein [Desulfovibrio sp.]
MQEYTADLHIHSRFSLATSRKLGIPLLAAWAAVKGLALIGTGDFTHPRWRDELRASLRFDETSGLYALNEEATAAQAALRLPVPAAPSGVKIPARFMLQGEINLIYKRGGKLRKIHNLVYMPNLEAADAFCLRLAQVGNLSSDGRPMLGLDSRDLLELVLECHPRAFLIPAHIWTPWFSLFGSKSGFDRLEDCFADLSPEIFALETGLSSDPAMNRLWSALDTRRLVSNSDAHSGEKLGREANVFTGELSYDGILNALKHPEKPGATSFLGTLEFFPEEGKYHLDGHRKCNVVLGPEETRRLGGLCPVCGAPLTVGVLSRVRELADRETPAYPPGTGGGGELGGRGFASLAALPEILSELLGASPKSRRVEEMYADLVRRFGPELFILRALPEEAPARLFPPLGEALRRMRRGDVRLSGGYDGEYGVVRMFDDAELADIRRGLGLPRRGGRSAPPAEARPTLSQAGFPPTPPQAESASVLQRTENPPTPPPAESAPIPPRTENPSTPPQAESAPIPPQAGVPSSSARTAPPPRTDAVNTETRSFRAAPAPPSSPEGLNEEQERAVAAGPGPVLVCAGPGTGKTRTLIARVLYLLNEGIDPRKIAAVTFTRRAAAEMDRRLADVTGRNTPLPRTDTLHALALELLCACRGGAPLLLDEAAARRVFAEANAEEGARRSADAWQALNLARERREALPPEFADYAARYMAQKSAWDFADYTDLPEFFLERLESGLYAGPYEHVLVDEIQDLSPLQLMLIRALVNHGNLEGEGFFGIGDPDQSVYSFRGAHGDAFRFFREAWPHAQVISLRRNYRSRPCILRAGRALFSETAPGAFTAGELVPERDDDARIRLFSASSADTEAAWVAERVAELIGTGGHSLTDARGNSGKSGPPHPQADHSPGDIAVLLRIRALARLFRNALARKGIPVSEPAGDVFWADARVAVILRAAGRMLGIAPSEEAEDTAFPDIPVRVLAEGPAAVIAYLQHTPPFDPLFRLSPVCRALLKAYEQHGGWAGLLSFAGLMNELELVRAKGEKVQIISLHAAKGLEFRSVFLPCLEDGLLPFAGPELLTGKAGDKMRDPDPEEERRLFYVGLTRAEDFLYLSHAGTRTLYGRTLRLKPSRFLAELPDDLLSRSVPVRRVTRREEHLPLL